MQNTVIGIILFSKTDIFDALTAETILCLATVLFPAAKLLQISKEINKFSCFFILACASIKKQYIYYVTSCYKNYLPAL